MKANRRYCGIWAILLILLLVLAPYVSAGRQYNPQIMRFMQPDPTIPDVYNPQSLNRYAYAYNNPMRYTDPEGETPWDAVDIGFLLYDTDAYWNDPSSENRDNLALSAVGALPIIPNFRIAKAGLSIGGDGLHALRAADKVKDGSRAVETGNDVRKVISSAKTIERLETADKTAWLGGKYTSLLVGDEGLTAYRVYTDEETKAGRWLTTIDPTTMSKKQLREVLALPDSNKINYWSQVNIPAGTHINYGTVGQKFGRVGGGSQIELVADKSGFDRIFARVAKNRL
jgi:RHS repeat-associated protein